MILEMVFKLSIYEPCLLKQTCFHDIFNNGVCLCIAVLTTVNHDHMKNRPVNDQYNPNNLAIIVLLWVNWAMYFLELVSAVRHRKTYEVNK